VGGVSAAVSTAVADGRPGRGELAAAFAAARARLGLVVLLFALAAVAWWSTADRMAGMDAGPGTDLGALGWFLGVWVVMMSAMMFPSLAPTVALYARMTRQRGPSRPLLFTSGYLLVWGTAGLGAYGVTKVYRCKEAPEGLAQPIVDVMAKVMTDNDFSYALFGVGVDRSLKLLTQLRQARNCFT